MRSSMFPEERRLAMEERRLAMEERRLAMEERQFALEKIERRAAFLEKSARMLRELASTEDDERHRLFLEDSSKNFMRLYVEVVSEKLLSIEASQPDTNLNTPITLSEVASDLRFVVSRADLHRIGKSVARAFRKARGTDPPKQRQFVDGALRDVHLYFEKDRAIIAECVRSYCE